MKSDIITRLEKEILPLQGYKPLGKGMHVDVGLGHLLDAFPGSVFPCGAIHEFCCNQHEEAAATTGFMAGLLTAFMKKGGAIIWISSSLSIFPPALISFGIMPEQVIFIDLQKEKDVLWAMEEALKCDSLAAVVAEVQELGFIASRRLQLTVEESRVTGFVIRRSAKRMNTTASITRWNITSLPGDLPAGLPGVGFPRWKVELLKVRNGKPGSWELTWKDGGFHHSYQLVSMLSEAQKKTG